MARQSSRAVSLTVTASFVLSGCAAGGTGSAGGSGSGSHTARPTARSSGHARSRGQTTTSLTARRALGATAAAEQKVILDRAAFYLHESALVRKTGKQWLRIPLSALHDSAFASFLPVITNINQPVRIVLPPSSQTFTPPGG